jgi:hypothetical protein
LKNALVAVIFQLYTANKPWQLGKVKACLIAKAVLCLWRGRLRPLRTQSTALAKIGAGLDRQPWSWARRIILEEFAGIGVDILVFLNPSEGPRWKHQPKQRHVNPTPKKCPPSRLAADLERKEASKTSESDTTPESTLLLNPASSIAAPAAPEAPVALNLPKEPTAQSVPTTLSTPEVSLIVAEGGKDTVGALNAPQLQLASEQKKSTSGRQQKPPPAPSQMTLRPNSKMQPTKSKTRASE